MIKILRSGNYEKDDILIRDRSGRDISSVVSNVIFSVKMGGDPSLLNYCKMFDGAAPKTLELSQEEIDDAIAKVPTEVTETLQEAAGAGCR